MSRRDQLEAELTAEETRYTTLIGQAAGQSRKPGELDAWALARHAHANCAQIRSTLRNLP